MTAKRPGPPPTMLHERVDLSGVEVLEKTTVAITPRAKGSAPAVVALTPALERDVFELARRVAMQADLAAAIQVLRQGMSRLTDSPEAMVVFYDPTTGSPTGDAPASVAEQAQQLVASVATSGERMVLPSAIIEPVGAAPAKAVIVIRRIPPHAPYGPLDCAIVRAIASSVAGILGHFQADHSVKKEQAARDAKTPFRPEALAERRRSVAAPGKVIATPRTWIRWAFPTLIGLVAAVIAAALIVRVPTYSTGIAIIVVDGTQLTTTMPGTVAEVLVPPNAIVAAGDPLVRMHAQQEEDELAASDLDYRNALGNFLINPGDDQAKMVLSQIATRRQRAQAAVELRTLRAPAAGVVGDIRVHSGQLMMPGAQVLKIAPIDATPSVIALLPGFDRPRLQVGMTVQIDLPGYRKKREEAIIDSIGSQVVGAEEARRSLGDPIGDALPIGGAVVIVRAHLTSKTFEAEGREFEFHDGMLGKAEVRVARKSLLRTLMPGGEGN